MKFLKMLGLAAVAATAFMAFASAASATTLAEQTVTTNAKITITASIESGKSAELRNTSGSIQNTCTASHVKGKTSTTTGTKVTGSIETLTFTGCTRTVTVHNPGKLYIEHIAGTENGTVYSEEAEITVGAPLVGYLTCKTGAGTHIGTLNGSPHGTAIMNINASNIPCGISAVWEGVYNVTLPEKLSVSA